MTAPTKSSVVAVVYSGIICAAIFGVRMVFPPLHMTGGSRRAMLQAEQARLAGFSEAAKREAETKLAEISRQLWTPESFARWRAAQVPPSWVVQDLGATDLKAVRSRRYAFQRPNATDRDWPEIMTLLGNLETARCVSVQSAALAVRPGYAGSRQFSQCLLVAVFYFLGDDGPELSQPATLPSNRIGTTASMGPKNERISSGGNGTF